MAFGNQPFYFQTMRKLVNTMGALLNGIDIVKANVANTAQTVAGKITVPVMQGAKEDWYIRLTGDPTANIGIQAQLPLISYELKGLQYDPSRKLSGYIKNYVVIDNFQATKYACAFPYNMNFEVTIWTRNIDDSFQIMEQILPFFDPNYVVALKYISAPNAQGVTEYVVDEVPFVLEGVHPDFQYEHPASAGGSRMVVWTLELTAKALFFGPLPQVGIIKEVIINFRNLNEFGDAANNKYVTMTATAEPNLPVDIITMFSNGSGFFSNNEAVQGQTSGAVANIVSWYTGNDALVVANVTGTFQTNEHIVGLFTGANFVSNTISTATLNVQYNVSTTTEF